MKTANNLRTVPNAEVIEQWDRVYLTEDYALDLEIGAQGRVLETYGTPPDFFYVEFPDHHTGSMIPGTSLSLEPPFDEKRKFDDSSEMMGETHSSMKRKKMPSDIVREQETLKQEHKTEQEKIK